MSETNWTKEDVDKVRMTIRNRARTDADFRQRVLRVPEQVIEEITGKSLPRGFNFDVIESKPGVDHTFILPPMVTDNELSDAELDKVAGGVQCKWTQGW